jgi:phosphoadenosine phosphosulfate reductase
MRTVPVTDDARDLEALRELAERAGRDLEGAHPTEILRWAADTFGTDLVLASSMGDEVLVHLAAEAVPGIDVIFLDTGYHFAETIGTRDAFAATAQITLHTILPRQTVAEQDAEHGPRLHDRDPNLCCALRKVEPLERGLAPYTAWVTGMRREDAPTRTDIPVVGWDAKRGKVKLNPLAAWTTEQVDAYAAEHHVLLNPLRQIGYTSIGCAPCTRAVAPGEDPRAGRWSGQDKTECGLHT